MFSFLPCHDLLEFRVFENIFLAIMIETVSSPTKYTSQVLYHTLQTAKITFREKTCQFNNFSKTHNFNCLIFFNFVYSCLLVHLLCYQYWNVLSDYFYVSLNLMAVSTLKFGKTRADTAPLTFTFICAKYRVSKYYQPMKRKYCLTKLV